MLPTTSDNSGVEPFLASDYQPNTLFDIGITEVMYSSMDGSNNVKTCTFNVTVIGKA